MRVLDQGSDRSLKSVLIMLTPEEAYELRDKIDEALVEPGARHEHVSSEDFQKEITICVYDQDVLHKLGDRARRLVIEDK